jgi:hypothetical protein
VAQQEHKQRNSVDKEETVANPIQMDENRPSQKLVISLIV